MVVNTLYILALDQARAGAWSIFDYKTKQLVHYGTFAFSEKKYTYAQAVMYIEQTLQFITEAYNIKAILLEDINLRANVKAFKMLAHLQGVLINFCEKNNYLYDTIYPSEWQGFCNARGRTSKEQAKNIQTADMQGKKNSKILSIQAAKEMYGIETNNDNLADAIMIGHYAVNALKIVNTKSDKHICKI